MPKKDLGDKEELARLWSIAKKRASSKGGFAEWKKTAKGDSAYSEKIKAEQIFKDSLTSKYGKSLDVSGTAKAYIEKSKKAESKNKNFVSRKNMK
jgi:hypothetical protein